MFSLSLRPWINVSPHSPWMWVLLIQVLIGVLDSVSGLSCSSTTGYLTATQSAQTLFSPGYPSDYDNNQNCKWLISTQDVGKNIQIEVIAVSMANWDSGACEDYLELKDGKDENASLIKKWCDPEPFQVKSKGQHILVKFITDHHVTAPGFALRYYQIDDYRFQCDPYQVRTINVGENPVFLDLPMYTERMVRYAVSANDRREITCDYHIKSQFNDDVTLNLEMLTFSQILCEDGSFAIHDGPNDDFPIIIDWCYSNKPFRHLTSSGKDIFIRFRLINSDTDWIVFRTKVTTKFKSISCSDKSMPNLEVHSTPTYFAFPQHRKLTSTRVCPLRLWTEKHSQTVRLEVISKEPPCGNRGVRIYDGFDLSSKMIGSLCDKTVFSSSTHSLVLSPINDNITGVVFLKASAIEATCNGHTEKRKVIHDEVRQVPNAGYAHDLNCMYLLESDTESDAVEISLVGRMVARDMFECEGDYVTLYDGDNSRSDIIATWCGANGQAKRYASKGPKMLVVITTDSYHSYGDVKLTYYAVPQKGGCNLVTELQANSSIQYLTSPNYPLYYPMNSYCEYKVLAPKEHFVQFEVLQSVMENDCSDTVRVYSGFDKKNAKYLGKWCGHEKPKYRSEGRELLLVFSADDESNSGGFHAKFYADKDTDNNYLIPTIIGSLLFAIVVCVLIAGVIYFFVRRRKRNGSGT